MNFLSFGLPFFAFNFFLFPIKKEGPFFVPPWGLSAPKPSARCRYSHPHPRLSRFTPPPKQAFRYCCPGLLFLIFQVTTKPCFPLVTMRTFFFSRLRPFFPSCFLYRTVLIRCFVLTSNSLVPNSLADFRAPTLSFHALTHWPPTNFPELVVFSGLRA